MIIELFFLFAYSASFISTKNLDYRLCWFTTTLTLRKFISMGKFSRSRIAPILSFKIYLRKSPLCWLNLHRYCNLHLQLTSVLYLEDHNPQRAAKCRLSFPSASPFKRQCHFFHTKLIWHAACDCPFHIFLHLFSKIVQPFGLFLLWLTTFKWQLCWEKISALILMIVIYA